ncbi:MAG TPA: hypothetical protein VFP09_05110 [Desertimonas sp.]|nr:hypothetical protein [Desertimonas sp.]
MSDESLFIDIQPAFAAVGELRTAIESVKSPEAIATPDVFEATATESLRAVAELVGSFLDYVNIEATLLANAESLGAMDAYRADNQCINWVAVEED